VGYLVEQPLELDGLTAEVSAPECGALCTFVGLVRNHHEGRAVVRLEYSAYVPMAEAECMAIVSEATAQWPVRVAMRHRIGTLVIGDAAVAVAVASAHRAAAFEACRFVIEELKRRVPIWKKEFFQDGTVEWVEPR